MKLLVLGTVLFASFMSGVHATEMVLDPSRQDIKIENCSEGKKYISANDRNVSGCIYINKRIELNRMITNAMSRGQLLIVNKNAKDELMYSFEDSQLDLLKQCKADLQTLSLAILSNATNNSQVDETAIGISNEQLGRAVSSGTQE